MKDPERLAVAGSDEDRALLRDADTPTVPEELRRSVRAAVEERVSPRGRRRAIGRAALAGASILIGGTALAYGVVTVRARLSAPQLEVQPPPRPGTRPVIQPLPDNAPPPVPAPPPAGPGPRRRPSAEGSPSPRPLPSLGGPGLPTPPGDWPLEEPARPAVPPSGGRLLIAHQGRQPVAITFAGNKITGHVRSAAVDLELQGQRILGKAADENVSLLIQGSEARGTIAGHDVTFALVPTRDGHIVRGSLPGHSARIELTATQLSWYPGCSHPLTLIAPGIYEGICAKASTRVMIPAPWQRLPIFPRLILLALFLTEPDPDAPTHPPTLFGPPDWPSD